MLLVLLPICWWEPNPSPAPSPPSPNDYGSGEYGSGEYGSGTFSPPPPPGRCTDDPSYFDAGWICGDWAGYACLPGGWGIDTEEQKALLAHSCPVSCTDVDPACLPPPQLPPLPDWWPAPPAPPPAPPAPPPLNYVLVDGAICTPGTEVTSEAECEAAASAVGIAFAGAAGPEWTEGCFVHDGWTTDYRYNSRGAFWQGYGFTEGRSEPCCGMICIDKPQYLPPLPPSPPVLPPSPPSPPVLPPSPPIFPPPPGPPYLPPRPPGVCVCPEAYPFCNHDDDKYCYTGQGVMYGDLAVQNSLVDCPGTCSRHFRPPSYHHRGEVVVGNLSFVPLGKGYCRTDEGLKPEVKNFQGGCDGWGRYQPSCFQSCLDDYNKYSEDDYKSTSGSSPGCTGLTCSLFRCYMYRGDALATTKSSNPGPGVEEAYMCYQAVPLLPHNPPPGSPPPKSSAFDRPPPVATLPLPSPSPVIDLGRPSMTWVAPVIAAGAVVLVCLVAGLATGFMLRRRRRETKRSAALVGGVLSATSAPKGPAEVGTGAAL